MILATIWSLAFIAITTCYVLTALALSRLQRAYKRDALPASLSHVRAQLVLEDGESVTLEPVIRIMATGEVLCAFMLPGSNEEAEILTGSTLRFGILDNEHDERTSSLRFDE